MSHPHPAAADLSEWLLARGLDGTPREDLLTGYCTRLVGVGLPLYRLHLAQRALHPRFGGIGFDWLRTGGGVSQQQYAHTDSPVQGWLQSPLYVILETGELELRERLDTPGHQSRFPLLNDLRGQGATDYFASGLLFETPPENVAIDPNNTPEGMLISWTSDAPGGFSETDLALIRATLPQLGLAMKSASNRRIAHDLLGTYLGRDAGARVLSGEIQRGSLQRIDAAILYFDLTGFTSLAERTPGPDLIAMLNTYFAVVVEAIHAGGGHVLKFMGDGLLAMFDQPQAAVAAGAALDTVVTLNAEITALNLGRTAQGLPVTDHTIALHAGEIFYGNIGAETRLDFTVIGPAVNLTARLSGMHRALGQKVILSEPIRSAVRDGPHDLVSLGRYMLRGVSQPQELFTLYTRKA